MKNKPRQEKQFLLAICAIIASTRACVDVAPTGVTPQPKRDSPYTLDYLPQVNYADNTQGIFQLYVELESPDSPFERFELHMEDVGTKKTVGHWLTYNKFEDVTKAVTCPGGDAAGVLTNSKSMTGKKVAGIWRPDSSYGGNVRPVATVVRDERTYWKDIKGSIYYNVGGEWASSGRGLQASFGWIMGVCLMAKLIN